LGSRWNTCRSSLLRHASPSDGPRRQAAGDRALRESGGMGRLSRRFP
jgi:hypothetical protein